MELLAGERIQLPVALNTIPQKIGDWTGKDVPIPYNVQQVAGNDDYVSRLYTNTITKEQVNLYIAYSARPRTMLGHRPDKCYVGSGWIIENAESTIVTTKSDLQIPCMIHHFQKPIPENRKVVVLHFYILNGQLTSDESSFSGLGLRTPNIAGNPARYVAQVQFTSVIENSVLSAAGDMTDLILNYFPDKEGVVRAAQ